MDKITRGSKEFEKEMEKVVREWIERMLMKISGSVYIDSADEQIDCPDCGRVKIIEDKGWNWQCPNCGFAFPRSFKPPSKEDIELYWKIKRINIFLKLSDVSL